MESRAGKRQEPGAAGLHLLTAKVATVEKRQSSLDTEGQWKRKPLTTSEAV